MNKEAAWGFSQYGYRIFPINCRGVSHTNLYSAIHFWIVYDDAKGKNQAYSPASGAWLRAYRQLCCRMHISPSLSPDR